MRPIVAALFVAAVLPTAAHAGMNKTYMVPAYEPCPGGATQCSPQPPSSAYTFDQAILRTPQKPFTAPNQTAVVVELKGVRDAAGNPVTTDPGNPADDFVFRTPAGRTVITSGTRIQLEPGSPLVPVVEVRIDLKNGKGKATYKTPGNTPTNGLVNQTLDLPVIYDPAGKVLASNGARTKP
jgi:hypothetical protein